MGDPIDDVIEEIIVDAYGEHEQLWSFRQVFEDEARFPFRGRVVGVEVEVASVDFDGDERRGLIARCRRAGDVHTVSLLDVTPEEPLPVRTRQLFTPTGAGREQPRSAPSRRMRRHPGCTSASPRSWST